jgi:hypothetical protein
MAKPLRNGERVGMKTTRDEVAALLTQSEKNVRESQQIARRLRSLKKHIDGLVAGKKPTKRKSPK